MAWSISLVNLDQLAFFRLKRALITVCEEYAVSHEMVFNHKKNVILICRVHEECLSCLHSEW